MCCLEVKIESQSINDRVVKDYKKKAVLICNDDQFYVLTQARLVVKRANYWNLWN